MESATRSADGGLLAWIARWSPNESEIWRSWRRSVSAAGRNETVLTLEALLSGLVAFRQLENHPLEMCATDFRPHLKAVVVTYEWALELVRDLRAEEEETRREPQASLAALARSLADARQVGESLLELPRVDAAVFQAGCDRFLRDLGRNVFFRPPEPIEFSEVDALVGLAGFGAALEFWRSDAAKTAIVVAFLTLLRNHRSLGIADRQIGDEPGLLRAHLLVASVRRDLRVLTRFLLADGVEAFAEELEARLLCLDANRISGARDEIAQASNQLRSLRESLEILAMEVHTELRAKLDEPLPSFEQVRLAQSSERLRNGIREVRSTLKDAARQLRHLADPRKGAAPKRQTRVLMQDVWSFHLILRAFLAKAAVASFDGDEWSERGSLAFVSEFARHFRVFGPKLVQATGYEPRVLLMRAIGELSRPDRLDASTLDRAVTQCEGLADHLAAFLRDAPDSLEAPLDKQKAAADLRSYLAAAKERSSSEQPAAAAFGVFKPVHANAG